MNLVVLSSLLILGGGASVTDPHSYSNPDQVVVRHVDLDLSVRFDRKVLEGTATLRIQRVAPGSHPLVLDARDLTITEVRVSTDGTNFTPSTFTLGAPRDTHGAPLTIPIPPDTAAVRIAYRTDPGAGALQWLDPSQTAGKRHPFLFTQGQSILTRTWIPLQDTPAVRVTYSARIRTPKGLVAVMSAGNDPAAPRDGDYAFVMEQAIPSYLIALAVGDIAFESMGPRTGVYAEPSVVRSAAREFADTERMMDAAERLYGKYRWGRYDLLVLPPSFPFGGMENPRLTFATPTIIAGDKSLVSLVAHELAHSWSGNLVTNATWEDLWLNEGFTTYVERRIVEEVFGARMAGMEAVLGMQTLRETLAEVDVGDARLHIDLGPRDPDDAFSMVPYEKGALFLRQIETVFGRERFDAWVRLYFEDHAFQSVTTDEFKAHIGKHLFAADPERAAKIPVDRWIHHPGLPGGAPEPTSDAFTLVEKAAAPWIAGSARASSIPVTGWTTQEWLHFLKFLPTPLGVERMAELDRAFRLTGAGNAEIAHLWLLLAIRNGYHRADERLDEYLVGIGRRKLVKPLYDELVKTPEGKVRARKIYAKARPGYHPLTVGTIDAVVGWNVQ